MIITLIFQIMHLEKTNEDCLSALQFSLFWIYVQVFHLKYLQMFTENDLERLLRGEQDTWDVCAVLLCSLVINLDEL